MDRRSIFNSSVVMALGMAVLTSGQHSAFAQIAEDRGDVKDRIAIHELLYTYAYAWDSKDCGSWANLFTADAILVRLNSPTAGRDAILQFCITRQKNLLGAVKTHHNMANIVFDQLTSTHAMTRSYVVITWQKPDEPTPRIQSAFTYRDVIVKQDDGRWLFKERHYD